MDIDKLIKNSIFILILATQAQAQENCFGDFCNKTQASQDQCEDGTCDKSDSNSKNTVEAKQRTSTSTSQITAGALSGSGSRTQVGSGCATQACISRGTGQLGRGPTPDHIRQLLNQ